MREFFVSLKWGRGLRVGKERSKEPGAAGSAHNVIELSAYRRKRALQKLHRVLYVTDEAPNLDLLQSIPSVATDSVNCIDSLRSAFIRRTHDVIFMDSELSWSDPVELIVRLTHLSAPPIILLCPRGTRRKNAVLKQAFSAGLHDALFLPLAHDELIESVEFIVKLRRYASLDGG